MRDNTTLSPFFEALKLSVEKLNNWLVKDVATNGGALYDTPLEISYLMKALRAPLLLESGVRGITRIIYVSSNRCGTQGPRRG